MNEEMHVISEMHLDADHVFCELHLAPFMASWPDGCSDFAMLAASLYSCATGGDVIGPGHLDHEPLCCILTPSHLLLAYTNNPISRTGICVNCRKSARGSPFVSIDHPMNHLCFYCVVHNMGQRD